MQIYFKTIFVNIVPFIVGYFVCYLVGSFVSVAFDPVMWSIEARTITATCGFFWGCAIWLKLMAEGLV